MTAVAAAGVASSWACSRRSTDQAAVEEKVPTTAEVVAELAL